MRPLVAMCLLAGCYQPSTESCYYACATQGAACPSGLTCVAGMCATPGTATCATGDGDSSSDAPGASCRDGVVTPGEICVGAPITFSAPNKPRFGQLVDLDGNTKVDLVWLETTNYSYSFNTGGMLSPTVTQGPAVSNATAMVPANFAPTPGVELVNSTPTGLDGYTAHPSAAGPQLFSRPTPQYPSATAIAFGPTTGGPIGALAVIHRNILVVYRFDSPTAVTEMGSYPIPDARDVAIGALDGDGVSDVVIATDNGVLVFLGSSLNLGSPAQFGPSIAVERVALGDFDNDGIRDIAFTVGDPVIGSLGILKGRGNGTFNTATFTHLPGLQVPLAVGDLDRDGRDDVVAFQTGSNPSLLIMRGKADGSVDAAIRIPVAASATDLSARGDFNDDKVPDIVLTDYTGGRVLVFPSTP